MSAAPGARTLSQSVRGAWRLARVIVHLLHAALIVVAGFKQRPTEVRARRVQWWSAKMLRLLGIGLVAQGTPRPGAKLLVANHVSWLDIAAINAVAPARFVSKAEVRHWPLFGWLAGATGTLYIERERPRDALRVVHQMAAALQAGDTLAVFPEGTTSDGHALLPFHANLLQAAVATGTPVQAVALRFADAERAISPAAEFIGETTLAQSLWRVACAQGLSVRVCFLTASSVAHADRRRLAQTLRSQIEAELA